MAQNTMTHVTLSVPDISCGHCEQAVTSALSGVAGIQGVTVDIPGRQARVEFDPAQVDIERMSNILAEANYPVAGATTTELRQRKGSTVPVAGCSCCTPAQ